MKSEGCGAKACKDTHPDSIGLMKNPLYHTWNNMKAICVRENSNYPEEWDNFGIFEKEVGHPEFEGSRFMREDRKLPYSKDNCYWMRIHKSDNLYTPALLSNGRYIESHGMHQTREYSIWRNMKTRCYNPKHRSFKNYGEKGIQVCPRWKDSFVNFWEDMKEGYVDGLTIDRRDSTKDYCLENCRWLTLEDNSGRSRAMKTSQIDKVSGGVIKLWDNARQAGLALDIDPSSISKVCKGKKKSAGGFCWSN